MTRFPRLSQIEISEPCTKLWEELDGDQQQRFCHACEEKVFNFAEMTTAEVRSVMDSGHRVCARVARRADGSLITRPESSGSGFIAKLTGLAASLTAALTLAGCARRVEQPQPAGIDDVMPAIRQQMGEVCALPPVETASQQVPTALLGRISVPQNQSE